jgi:hypothetical protein
MAFYLTDDFIREATGSKEDAVVHGKVLNTVA